MRKSCPLYKTPRTDPHCWSSVSVEGSKEGTPSPIVCESMKGWPVVSQEVCLPSLLPSTDGSFLHYGSQSGQ